MSGSENGEVLREVKIAATGQLQWLIKKKTKTLFHDESYKLNENKFLYKFTIFVVRNNKERYCFMISTILNIRWSFYVYIFDWLWSKEINI
jgi:hypothetical protein